MTPNTTREAEAKSITLELLDQIFSTRKPEFIKVRLWDGTVWPLENRSPFTLILNHPGALRKMLLPGTEVGLAEAYLYNDIDIEGKIEEIFSLADMLTADVGGLAKKLRLYSRLKQLPESTDRHPLQRGPAHLEGKRHSIQRDRQAVTYHYNVSNDFYALFLDPQMVYSCAYFQTADDSLAEAQERKLDYICRKMRLRTGQRILDIGCGWGGLVIWAAQHYGVDATGITLSQPQADYANKRIAELGIGDHCRVEVIDYRQVPEQPTFDALVSVGMFEHVGEQMLAEYFAKALRLLKPQGVFLNHGISSTQEQMRNDKGSFSDAYVFPDGELVQIHKTIAIAEGAGFETRDVESLREHYMLTLQHWVERLEANHERALQYVDEGTYRVWRLFMSGSIYGFDVRRQNIYQTLLVKADKEGRSGLPLTRSDWYRREGEPERRSLMDQMMS